MLFELRPLSFESEGLSGALELRLNTVERRRWFEDKSGYNWRRIIVFVLLIWKSIVL